MTTLAKDKARSYELGTTNEFPIIASDIIYENAAVGIVDATGHARPLNSADQFVGFAEQKVDNSAGSAADRNVRVRKTGMVQLSVSGAVITDLNQPVYATDDDTFVFLPVAAVFIGFVRRFVSAGVVIVEFNVGNDVDPYAGRVLETKSSNYTTTILDNGKTLFIDTDAFIITMLTYAAATALDIKVVNIGAFGTILVAIDPASGDKIAGPGDTGADGGILANTKATARRGDFTHLQSGGDDGYIVKDTKGIWTIA